MLVKSSKLILRYRLPIIIVIGVITLLMGFLSKDLEIDYKMSKVVPADHPKLIDYQNFRKKFGEDGNFIIIAVKRREIFDLDFYRGWAKLGQELLNLDGVEQFLGISNAYDFVKNKEDKKFELVPLPEKIPETREEMEQLHEKFRSLPFYDKLLFDEEKGITFMALTLDENKINSDQRVSFFKNFDQIIEQYESEYHGNLYISGLPYIRNHKVETMKAELVIVLIYSVLILISILFFLFRSGYAVIFPVIVVGIGVIWCGGLMHLLGYKINILTSLVPNLIVIIGIPNCVYLLNKYHLEFRKHGNKARALSRVIQRIGYVTFFANLTTAIGFGVFAFSDSGLLKEFGVVAGIMISLIFLISLICIPIMFSYLPDPVEKQMKHLDRKALAGVLNALNSIATNHRRKVYFIAILVIMFAISGSLLLQTKGFILDDVPHESKVYKDLKFVEESFKGIMPLEILIDTKKPRGAMDLKFLSKIDKVQDTLFAHKWFSKPTSIVNGLKFSTQAYFNGNSRHYRLPKDNFMTPEMSFIMTYLKNSTGDKGLVNNFVDSTKQVARISTKIPDIGSDQLPVLMQTLNDMFSGIFDKDKYDVSFTGTSIVAYEGYRYLVNGLVNSVAIAFVLIALIMGYLFRSFRMLMISLIPNIIPLFFTAGIMGYFDIPLKPSTVLVFSVAFGISVDFTIHFLAKYKQELARHDWDIAKTVSDTIQETGPSMIYTSLILFFGFITFTASSFDGTKYMGLLVSITLVASLFANLLLLPSLLMSFDKIKRRKARKKELKKLKKDGVQGV